MKKKSEKKGFKGFLKSWIPWKGDSAKQIIIKILVLILLVVFVGSCSVLIRDLVVLPAQTDSSMEEIRDLYRKPTPPSSSQDSEKPSVKKSPKKTKPVPSVQEQLKRVEKINPDIIGWIRVPKTVIDYPVLQSGKKDPEYYLYRNYRKEHTKYGSIFMDSLCTVDSKTQNKILYGHSMRDGRMFAELLRFANLDFYKNSPVLQFDTKQGEGQWKIMAVFRTNTDPSQGKLFEYLTSRFGSKDRFVQFVYEVRKRSIINTDVDFNANDEILTLSTCSYEFPGFRTVVVARKVRKGESAEVNTEKASYNSKVVYPECWYKKHGGSCPVWPKTWQEAKKQGLIPWLEIADKSK